MLICLLEHFLVLPDLRGNKMEFIDMAGILPQPFGAYITKECEEYAMSKFPEEACGIVVDEGDGYIFIPKPNIADDPLNNFKIDGRSYASVSKKATGEPNSIAVWHSHPNSLYGFSQADMETQMMMGVPMGITWLNEHGETVPNSTFWLGDTLEIAPLLGRPFIHGLYDCFSLARDYYRLQGYEIKDFPRPEEWWMLPEDNPKHNMYMDCMKECGFHVIGLEEAKVGDVVLAKILSPVNNHAAVILDNGLILHHLHNRLSQRQPQRMYRKFMNTVITMDKV